MALGIIRLDDLLQLVGNLDDTPGENTPRERFREYLRKTVNTPGTLRDYVETCLRTSGTQYNRALQDLVNHAGSMLKFEVENGRYQGVVGQVGHDGLWKSPTGTSVVVEVKTTDAYTIKTATLLGYIDGLVSEKKIPSRDLALGLYIVGRTDANLAQLQNSILQEKLDRQLRVATVEAMLSLVELIVDQGLSHQDVLGLLRPSPPVVDETIEIIARIASEAVGEGTTQGAGTLATTTSVSPASSESQVCFLTSVSDKEEGTGEQALRDLLGQGVYVFGERTPGLRELKSGVRMCFYWSGHGVVAEAIVAGTPERKKVKVAHDPDKYPWSFPVKNARFFFDKPVVIDAGLRARLDAFKNRDPEGAWAWFVQITKRVTPHDFDILVNKPT